MFDKVWQIAANNFENSRSFTKAPGPKSMSYTYVILKVQQTENRLPMIKPIWHHRPALRSRIQYPCDVVPLFVVRKSSRMKGPGNQNNSRSFCESFGSNTDVDVLYWTRSLFGIWIAAYTQLKYPGIVTSLAFNNHSFIKFKIKNN